MRIIVKKEGAPFIEVPLGEQPIFFGRSPENDVVLSDSNVSRRHTKLTLQKGRILLEDLKSFNGTKVHGQKTDRAELSPGDFFEIGPFEIFIEEEELPKATDEDEDSFVKAIAVRPSTDGKASDEFKVLKSFLTEEEPKHSNARLVRLDGPEAGKRFPLEKDEVTMGKADENDVVVDEGAVAPKHASIVKQSAGFVLKDENQSTGTFVDGVPIRERALENHDVLQIGEARFEYVEGASRSIAEVGGDDEPPERGRTSSWTGYLTDWRIIMIAGAAAAFLVLAILPESDLPVAKKEATAPPTAQTPLSAEDETARLTAYHLKNAKEMVARGKLAEAEQRLDILDSIVPNNPQARELRMKIAVIRAEEKRKADLAKKKESDRLKKISNLLAKGDARLRAKKLAEARRIYQQALALDAANVRGKEAIEQIATVEKEQRKRDTARQKELEEIKKLYVAGATKFDAGELGEAEKLLSQVASKKGNPYQASAQNYLNEIHKLADQKVLARVDEAKKLLDADQIIPAYEELKKIVRQFPKRGDAAKLFMKAQIKMTERAKAAYQEGLAQQQLAEDPAAALDRYQEVLKYAPDPESEYHKKAKKKIEELQLSP